MRFPPASFLLNLSFKIANLFGFLAKKENTNQVDDNADVSIAQVVCSLQNREECMACGS